ncbi:lactoferrin/transferrin family TonB-dependent receptor [Testudinibacter sp. P27/CKL/0425]
MLSGSGALGGAVIFTSKDPDDVIKPGQNYGLDITNRYSSKDDRWSKSFAAAGRAGGFSALLQYTRRDGHEIKAHKDTPNQTLWRMFPTEYQYDDLRAGGWNAVRPSHFPQHENCSSDSQLPWRCFDKVNLAPNDVYGETRNAADPMNYRSDSWYGKVQYEITPSHKIGFLFEDTKQLREIEKRSYSWANGRSVRRAFYHNLDEANTNWNHAYPYYALFPRYDFVDHDHSKKRIGVFYEYQAAEKNPFLDKLKVELDHDRTIVASRYTLSRCTLVGEKPNRDCSIFDYKGELITDSYDVNGIGHNNHIEFQKWRQTQTALDETYDRLRLTAQKSWNYFGIKHDLDLVAGIGRSKFDLSELYLQKGYLRPWSVRESKTLPNIQFQPVVDTDTQSPNNYPIYGKSYYVGMSHNLAVGRYLDLIGGLRYDGHKFDSQLPYFKNDKYDSISWALGASLNLSDHFSVHYKSSTGFRIPNAQEMYGSDFLRERERNLKQALGREKIKKEEALNHEIGFDLHGNVGYLTVNVFRTDYKNFITVRSKKVTDVLNYPMTVSYTGNQTEAFSEGFNIRGMIDFHELWDVIPAGFSGNAAYSKVRPRKMGKISGDRSNWQEESFAMDTLQPAKTVLGLDYDAPNGKWGLGVRFTRSDAKKVSELRRVLPNIDIRGSRELNIVPKVSKSWYTWDVNGYVELHKNVILRGGVYNLTNAKYITWESLRQLGKPGISTADATFAHGLGYDRLTAPGRNFAVSLEMKF